VATGGCAAVAARTEGVIAPYDATHYHQQLCPDNDDDDGSDHDGSGDADAADVGRGTTTIQYRISI
jgi:hypothetical protein